ncbi:MAG: AgmX/PglI C-terminal domain-containing protein [Sandaracinaceae bacterium]
MRTSMSVFGALLLLAGCGPTTEPEDNDVRDQSGSSGGEANRGSLPELRRLGAIARGDFLFDGAALGTGDTLHPAHLVTVEPDHFTVMVDGGPHRQIPRGEAWPMACATEAIEHSEGSMTVRFEAGAPLFVLAATTEAARVSAALHSEHSVVVRRSALTTSECDPPAPASGSAYVAEVADGNVPCVFPDQETLDESAGLPVPAGAALEVEEEDGDWAHVRVFLRGTTVDGWVAGDLVTETAPGAPDWTGIVVSRDRCMFPGRPEAQPWQPATTEGGPDIPPPTIPAIEIERVMRQGEPQIQACYAARLNEFPELTVRLSILLLVDADGRVYNASITEGRTADAALSACALERVRRWRFPPPRSGAVNVRHTFDLRPSS